LPGSFGLEQVASVDQDRPRHPSRQILKIQVAKLVPFRDQDQRIGVVRQFLHRVTVLDA
jgi:hypothetical protein